jgi:hypothetical protein
MLQTLAPALGLGLEIRFKAAIRPGVRLVSKILALKECKKWRLWES